MSLRIELLQAQEHDRWDAFVRTSRNGNFFHTRSFLAYHPHDRFVDASLWILDGDVIRAALPAAKRDIDGKVVLVAHPGASYGGIVFAEDVGVQESGEIVAALEQFARDTGYHAIHCLRLPPTSIRREYAEDQEYWFYQKGWTCARSEMDGSIDLSAVSETDVLSYLTSKCRNMVRQAERAKVETKLTNDFAGFWPILNAALQRHDTHPTHTLEEMQKLHTLCPNDVRLVGGYVDEKLVGGIVVITLNKKSLYTLYMAQDYEHQGAHPMHALLTEVMRMTIREGRCVLHVGVSTEAQGKVINEGLFFFKESFHCRPVRRETWEKML
jgi:hypothetical protein